MKVIKSIIFYFTKKQNFKLEKKKKVNSYFTLNLTHVLKYLFILLTCIPYHNYNYYIAN